MTTANSHESTGSTVEEAITHGLTHLNLPREAVEIEILDEGSKGLFGLGAREAVVRLTPRVSPPAAVSQPAPTPIQATTETPKEMDMDDESMSEDDLEEMEDLEMDIQEDEILTVARETVTDLLQKMHVDADVVATYQPQDDDHRQRPNVLVEVNGDDLSILIGRQAETLNALQYITRLIVSKELNQGVDLEVDVQGYRARRHEQLRRLARQMADQAIRTGKRQFLEPMAPDDRRIIHIALRNHPQVLTESQGEGTRRKVTIVPK
ncbi:MAG TPA: RNA-binding cell elongation regulator Jag/EloR [Anaerolineales bacterium]|nr:RNA-binding cell elongation regulator Jag/EloR [Anaerolineales bacterium]